MDDGYSGRNFERPAMRELLEEVRAGNVYGIIVKDFSRFGRNFIEVGIEKIFPMLGVRFIAVNNQFDSIAYEGITPDMDVSFQNLMYDYFSAENSVKIKNDLLNRRKRGKFLGTSAPLGYMKSPQDHNQFIIESEAAEIVKLIFKLFDECGVKAEVARYLNANHIPTPLEYAVQKGRLKRWRYSEEKKFWSGAIVGKILKNEIYIGNTVLRKSEVQEPASSKRIFFSRKDCEIYENAHEPIISKELFEWVNSPDFISKQEKEKLNGKEAERIEQRNREKVCGRGEKHKYRVAFHLYLW